MVFLVVLKHFRTLLEAVGQGCQIKILDTLDCLMLTLNVENVLQLVALGQQMSLTVIPIYSTDVRYRLM
jgi:hypothetical protein